MHTILLIDDDPESLEILSSILEQDNSEYNLMRSTNPKKALKLVRRLKPDLVISDWDMPQMTGPQFISALRQDAELADIPVIIITGVMTEVENFKSAIDTGAVGYLRKPVDPPELTSRVQVMLRLTTKLEEVKQLNATKDRLFSILSHDLRSPVNSLEALLEVFESGNFSPEEFQQMTKSLSVKVRRVSNLLDNLLRWASAQLANREIQTDIQVLAVRDVVTSLLPAIEPELNAKHQNFVSEIASEYVLADRKGLRMILRNLLNNAVKFTPERGRILLSVTTEGESILFQVKNTGEKIPKALRDRLFQGAIDSQQGTVGEKGTGLGLLLSHHFAVAQNGEMGVDIEDEEGTCFWLRLPRPPEDAGKS